jgi:hypothetical protein
MTYTFKLARRLAVSRSFGTLSALVLFAACNGGDANAPTSSPADVPESGIYDWRPRASTPVAVDINPSSVTLETNQLVRFRANGRNRAGDTVAAPVVWSTTGGTILPDGRFSAATVGTYQVVGTSSTREDSPVLASSTVNVVRRQIGVTSLAITPGSVTLTPGVSQLFSAVGYLKNGKPVEIGAYWSATGGSVDAGGTYVAGDTAGSYRVIATNTSGTIADTAVIAISAPAPSSPPPDSVVAPTPPPDTTTAAPPPPAPEPAPAPTLVSVTLMPAGATLAPGTTKLFTAYGRTSAGDSIALSSPSFTANGGTVVASGVTATYTAGLVAGSYRIILTSGSLADTSAITVTQSLGSGSTTTGMPVGLSGLLAAGVSPAAYSMSVDAYSADNILSRLADARTRKIKVLLYLAGGAHSNYMTNGVFDMAKWKAKLDTYNTSAIKTAIAAGAADGTIVGTSVMDEPQNTSTDPDNLNSWGPAGTMTKAKVDQLCSYVKNIFPTLPVGVVHDHRMFEPDKNYAVCEFIVSQYRSSKGTVQDFRTGGLAYAARDGIGIMFALNVMNGGTSVLGCPVPQTGGPGTYGSNCRMTPQQVRDFGLVLGPAGCGLNMWRYDATFFANSDNRAAVQVVADSLAKLPWKGCRQL